MDLSAVADGYGLGVQRDKVIANVELMIRHLADVQGFEHVIMSNRGPEPALTVPGDPTLFFDASNRHSLICLCGMGVGAGVICFPTVAYVDSGWR